VTETLEEVEAVVVAEAQVAVGPVAVGRVVVTQDLLVTQG